MIDYKLKIIPIISIIIFTLLGCNNSNGNGSGKDYSQKGYAEESIPVNVTEAIASSNSILTQDLKDSISYMYNEEKLAKDIYLNIYKTQKVEQLYNIASKSEIKHEEAVNELAIKYDLNITLYPDTESPYDKNTIESYGNGEYPIIAIQELYDMLYDKGIESNKDALEVGCMVEVTDINDLDKYISQAISSNATDVLEVFNFLREGSYKHYWAFNDGLEKMGISDGCCSLGSDYCYLEYPQNSSKKGK